jgi:hypothetical protein
MGSRPSGNSTHARRAGTVKPSRHLPAHSPDSPSAILVRVSAALDGVSKAAGSGDVQQFRTALRGLRNTCIAAELMLAKGVRS